ncbi:MAG: hypothetical protein SOZ80_00780 [Prevotella sp.]|uniref:hypothetical protein n=1 Tax=Prevotella sp. TaxID=59823 RepID=UPI002A312213|nr:hypothetical protein [Prevotella sp.]MDD7318743.1 hypothetical protein [Prevotellaceae bacterium]MDY4019301.1 hypothetical protein [Prevotella sp.]
MKKIYWGLLTFLLISCDPYIYNIEIDNNGSKEEFVLDCGRIDISAIIIGYKQTTICQNIKPNYPIFIDPNGLKVSYKGRELSTNVFLNGNIIKDTMDIYEESTLRIVINHLKINNRDSIKLNIDNFINFAGKKPQINDINLIYINRRAKDTRKNKVL